MGSVQNSVVCITGASRGLGEELAYAFDKAGAHLILGARNEEALSAIAARCQSAIPVRCDVGKVDDVRNLTQQAIQHHGRLDIMINNAGLAVYSPFEDTTEEDFDQMLHTNVKGCYFGSQAAFIIMKQQRSGLIVNISSVAGKWHLPNESAYNASKWAVNGFTGTLRLEAEPHNVKVTCVCPGGINTPFWKGMSYYPFDTQQIDPERDFMDPAEIAQTVLQIAQTSDSYVVPEVMMTPLISS